jgi:hypothetical protein
VSWAVQLALPRRTRKAQTRRSFTRGRYRCRRQKSENDGATFRFDLARRLRGRDRSTLGFYACSRHTVAAPAAGGRVRSRTEDPDEPSRTEATADPRTPIMRSDRKQVSRAGQARTRPRPDAGPPRPASNGSPGRERPTQRSSLRPGTAVPVLAQRGHSVSVTTSGVIRQRATVALGTLIGSGASPALVPR